MNEKHISSAVALGPQNRYSGLVDLMDITRYFVSVCATDEEELPANRPDTATDRFQEKLEVLKHATIAGIIKTPDAEASPGFQGKRRKSASSWYYPISTEMSLYNAIETLGVTGQHRLPIINSVGRVTGVVTESMIIRWIYYNKDICDQSVMETQIMHLRKFRNLVTIHENQSALAAFTLMVMHAHAT